MAWLLAPLYDRFVAPVETETFGPWRRELLADLSGTVLEIGSGTGAGITQHPGTVDKVIFTEPDRAMRKQLTRKLEAARDAGTFAPAEAEVLADGAEALSVADGSCDAVVASLVLCSVTDPARALAEVRRVLRPGGTFVFMEHVAAENHPDRLKWQRRLEPIWRRVAGGCRLTRRTRSEIEAAGFEIRDLVEEHAPNMSPLMSGMIRGRATVAE